MKYSGQSRGQVYLQTAVLVSGTGITKREGTAQISRPKGRPIRLLVFSGAVLGVALILGVSNCSFF